MVDEDFVMGYVVGYNSKKIIEKTITANGTYHAADDNADGYDPVVVNVSAKDKKSFEEGYKLGYDNGYEDGSGGDTYDETPPDVQDGSENDAKPSVEYEGLYLTTVSSDGNWTYVMYGIPPYKTSSVGLTKEYYVDSFYNGVLKSHSLVYSCGGLAASATDPDPSYQIVNSCTLRADGTIKTIGHLPNGSTQISINGPYIGGGSQSAAVWNI